MSIRLMKPGDDLTVVATVMQQLRPALTVAEIIARMQQQQSEGYQLVCEEQDGDIRALAGFVFVRKLAWGKALYVDDLVTEETHRSKGAGKRLMDWLKMHAVENGCEQLHLDSGRQREDAHRFYAREGFESNSLHFVFRLASSQSS